MRDYALDSQSCVWEPMMIILGQLFYCVILFDDCYEKILSDRGYLYS